MDIFMYLHDHWQVAKLAHISGRYGGKGEGDTNRL